MRIFPVIALLPSSRHRMAQTLDIREGLWEATSTATIDGLQVPPALLQSLPEESRAQVERLDGRPRVDRACVTQKNIAQGFARFDKDSACVRETVAATPRRFEAHVTCGGVFAGTGTARVEAPSATHVQGSAALQSLFGNIRLVLDARWLSANCGAKKP